MLPVARRFFCDRTTQTKKPSSVLQIIALTSKAQRSSARSCHAAFYCSALVGSTSCTTGCSSTHATICKVPLCLDYLLAHTFEGNEFLPPPTSLSRAFFLTRREARSKLENHASPTYQVAGLPNHCLEAVLPRLIKPSIGIQYLTKQFMPRSHTQWPIFKVHVAFVVITSSLRLLHDPTSVSSNNQLPKAAQVPEIHPSVLHS